MSFPAVSGGNVLDGKADLSNRGFEAKEVAMKCDKTNACAV